MVSTPLIQLLLAPYVQLVLNAVVVLIKVPARLVNSQLSDRHHAIIAGLAFTVLPQLHCQ